jgi:hypothetical protein
MISNSYGKGIGVLRCADIPQTQILYQTILQRKMCAFNAALSLAAVGTNPRDVETLQSATELSLARTAVSVRVIYAKNAGLIAVKRQRASMAFKIGAGGIDEIAESGIAVDKAEHHQPIGCVIDIHQQRACRPADNGADEF